MPSRGACCSSSAFTPRRSGRLPRPIEFLFNTPSHHRVHHGSQQQYLDRNYGGILIVWDRIFGTFEPEGERVRYGLTRNIETFNPVRVAFHEYVDIWRDVRAARSWRDRVGYALRGPGWRPAAAQTRPWARSSDSALTVATPRHSIAPAGEAEGKSTVQPPSSR